MMIYEGSKVRLNLEVHSIIPATSSSVCAFASFSVSLYLRVVVSPFTVRSGGSPCSTSPSPFTLIDHEIISLSNVVHRDVYKSTLHLGTLVLSHPMLSLLGIPFGEAKLTGEFGEFNPTSTTLRLQRLRGLDYLKLAQLIGEIQTLLIEY